MKNNLIKSLILCSCFVMALISSCRNHDSLAGDLLLSDNWKVQSSARTLLSGRELSTPQAEVQGWYEAAVPSTVMGTLTRNGLYADALEGMNYKNIDKALFDTTWWYRTEFEWPQPEKGRHTALMFDGISYAANVYCLSVRPDESDWAKTTWVRTPLKKYADFTGLSAMPDAAYTVDALAGQENENVSVVVTVENSLSGLAFFTRLSLKNEQGELLCPVFWDDNYISLAPGEKRTLKCVVPRSVVPSGDVTLTVSGWNVPERKISLSVGNKK